MQGIIFHREALTSLELISSTAHQLIKELNKVHQMYKQKHKKRTNKINKTINHKYLKTSPKKDKNEHVYIYNITIY